MKTKLAMSMAVYCLMSVSSGYSVAAGSVDGTLNVQITIGNGCDVTGTGVIGGLLGNFGAINFGTYPALDNPVNGQSTVTGGGNLELNCTTGTAYTVSLNNGLNASGTQRRMAGGVLPTAYVNYNLYQNSARTTPWNSTSTLQGTGTGSPVDITVYGAVPAQTTPSAGVYTDIVTMTITW